MSDVTLLRDFAQEIRERYPEDVWPRMTDDDHREVNDALAGRRTGTRITRDRVSADMMRRAAAQADRYADEIEQERESSGNATTHARSDAGSDA